MPWSKYTTGDKIDSRIAKAIKNNYYLEIVEIISSFSQIKRDNKKSSLGTSAKTRAPKAKKQ